MHVKAEIQTEESFLLSTRQQDTVCQQLFRRNIRHVEMFRRDLQAADGHDEKSARTWDKGWMQAFKSAAENAFQVQTKEVGLVF